MSAPCCDECGEPLHPVWAPTDSDGHKPTCSQRRTPEPAGDVAAAPSKVAAQIAVECWNSYFNRRAYPLAKKIDAALAVARAQGEASERKRCISVVELWENCDYSTSARYAVLRILAALREGPK